MTRDVIADALEQESAAARMLLVEIAAEAEGDEALAEDMIEGETGLKEALSAALAAIDDANVIVEGCKAVEAKYADRRAKAQRRVERVRALCEMALAQADVKTIHLPEATLTLGKTPPKVLITDEALLPSSCFTTPDPKIDKNKVKEMLGDGEVSGAVMSNGGIALKIKRV